MSDPIAQPESNPEQSAVEPAIDVQLRNLLTEGESLVKQLRSFSDESATHNGDIRSGYEWLTAQKTECELILKGISDSKTEVARLRADVELDATGATTARQLAHNSATDVESHRVTSEQTSANLKTTFEKGQTCLQTLADYESKLNEKIQSVSAIESRIENLLAGATGVGLAISFDKRKKEFAMPRKIWNVILIISVLGIVSVTMALDLMGVRLLADGSAEIGDQSLSNFSIWMFKKLLFSGPFIFLAWYASKQADLSRRVEEDYAFKVATAVAFEGFKKQVQDLSNLDDNAPLKILSERVLEIMTERPSNVFEKHDRRTFGLFGKTLDTAGAAAKSVSDATKVTIIDAKP